MIHCCMTVELTKLSTIHLIIYCYVQQMVSPLIHINLNLLDEMSTLLDIALARRTIDQVMTCSVLSKIFPCRELPHRLILDLGLA